MSHVVIRQAQATAQAAVCVHGPLYLWSWDDSLWHEYRVQEVSGDTDNVPPAVLMQEIATHASLPVGVPEVETLIVSSALWWKETWHIARYHHFAVMRTDEGDNILQDVEVAWVLPNGSMTEYTAGLGVKAGVYMQGQDALYHKFVPMLDDESGVVLFVDADSKSYAVF